MTTISKEKFKELLDALPEDVAQIYEGEETAQTILEIGRKYGLTIDKLGRLTSETGYVVVGAAPAREFVSAIQKALGITPEKAAQIGREINARVFASIRNTLKKIHNIDSNQSLLEESLEREAFKTPTHTPKDDLSDRAYWEEVSKLKETELKQETMAAANLAEPKSAIPSATLPASVKATEERPATSPVPVLDTQPQIKSDLAEEVAKVMQTIPAAELAPASPTISEPPAPKPQPIVIPVIAEEGREVPGAAETSRLEKPAEVAPPPTLPVEPSEDTGEKKVEPPSLASPSGGTAPKPLEIKVEPKKEAPAAPSIPAGYTNPDPYREPIDD